MVIGQGFTAIEDALVLSDKLTWGEFRVLFVIKKHARQSDYAFPKPETIAEATGLQLKVVNRYLKSLAQEHKLIAFEKDAKGRSGYRLLDIPAEFTGGDAVTLAVHRQAAESKSDREVDPVKVYRHIVRRYPGKQFHDLIRSTVKDMDCWYNILQDQKAKGNKTIRDIPRMLQLYQKELLLSEELAEAEPKWDEIDEPMEQQDAPPRGEAQHQEIHYSALENQKSGAANTGSLTAH